MCICSAFDGMRDLPSWGRAGVSPGRALSEAYLAPEWSLSHGRANRRRCSQALTTPPWSSPALSSASGDDIRVGGGGRLQKADEALLWLLRGSVAQAQGRRVTSCLLTSQTSSAKSRPGQVDFSAYVPFSRKRRETW